MEKIVNDMNVNLGFVVEEGGQPLIAFHPDTIDLIAKTLSMKDGDVIEVTPGTDSDGEAVITLKTVKESEDNE